jgi:hypothetical protein
MGTRTSPIEAHLIYKEIVMPENTEPRPLYIIAKEIRKNWKPVGYAAKPYLEAMESLDNIHQNYYFDTADSVVRYFLSNARSWRGDIARRVKAELKDILKSA